MTDGDTGTRLFNTLTHRVEPFRTGEPGLVRMYVCGPTVYDRSHVGHARSYVLYDALKRLFEAKGLRVLHVQNFTDIEESIRRRAEEAGVAPLDWADRHAAHFLEEMDALLVRRADAYPRVTEHVPEIQAIVQTLCEKDVAYRIECLKDQCNVYFDTSRVADFGALIGSTLEELVSGAADDAGERRQAADFALWKSRDDWGVTWPSPWGDGRPGWHIECAAMASQHFDLPFDLHGGGLDLVFPHHEAERAIAAATWDRELCRHYVHNGFVTVEARKMSKSKGNFVYLHELLAAHEPEALRTWLLGTRYRDPLPYSPRALADARARLERWRAGAARARAAPARAAVAADAARELREALDDDFDTPRAMAVLDQAAEAGLACSEAFELAGEVLGLPSLARR